MKKKTRLFTIFLFILSIIFIITLLYLVIININRTPKIGTLVIHKANSNYVTMSVKKDTLTNKSLTAILTNNSNEEYTYGNMYTIEFKKNGLWHYMKPTYKVSFLLNAITLEKKSIKEINFDWEDYYGKLPKGKYRIMREFESTKTNKKFYVSCDFVIK